MSQPYTRFQVSTALAGLVTVIGGAVIGATLAFELPISVISIVVGAALLLLLFGGLRVRVDDTQVTLAFGVGLIRKRIDRAEITAAEAVRNKWWYGYGIRLTPDGWMWNASGLDAVQLTYRDGTHFRIGTDEPEKLIRALDV